MSEDTHSLLLLVEDDVDIRESLRDLLRSQGFIVDTAVHGADALRLLESGRIPDVILLDLMMPVMDGWQFTEALRRSPLRHLPVIVLTAGQVEAPDADAVFIKPTDIDQLIPLIRRYARLRSGATRAAS
jgi:CheY-like chemotaxis protein